MKVIDGKQLAANLRAEIAAGVAAIKAEKDVTPGLAVILVGENPASVSYVTAKEKACAEAGMYSREIRIPAPVDAASSSVDAASSSVDAASSPRETEEKLLSTIAELNADPAIHGILVQLPLPKGFDEKKVIDAIAPEKDVDGFTPVNVGKMLIGEECFLPCTPHGIIKLIEFSGMDLKGKHAVVIGRSNIVGKPVAVLLARKETNATVTLCHTGTPDVSKFTKEADVVVVAAGRPNTLTGDMLKPGAVVIDVGVNRIPDATKPKGFRLVGDADYESCSKVASAITPVPGGVGPMTITMLLWNTLESVRRKALLFLAACAGVLSLEARTFEVAAWRGETVAVLAPEVDETVTAPKGVDVKYGVLRPVRYAPTVRSLERLEKFDRVEWKSKAVGPAVAEITVAPEAKPGVYPCGPMTIRVVDRILPPPCDWKYFLDLWQHPWAVSRLAKVRPFSSEHYAAMKPVYELLATAGQKTITTTLLDEPWDHQCYDAYRTMIVHRKLADGSWSFDYSVFDEYVDFCFRCGLGPNICCYTMCPWGYVVRWLDADGETQSCVAKPGSKEFEDYWGVFLDDFAKHLSTKGWLGQTFIAMDERSPEDVKAIANFIRAKAPGLRISMAGNRKPSDFVGITIDAYSQVLFENCLTQDFLKEAATRRQEGFVTTFYVCCAPDYPNTFMSSAAGEAFWLGAYPAMCGLDGFLRWAWNSWPRAPKADATYGNWKSGDTFLCYPGGEPSWRFLELRNGIIAAEKVRLLKAAGLFGAELGKLADMYRVGEATKGKSDFEKIRRETLDVVNRD